MSFIKKYVRFEIKLFFLIAIFGLVIYLIETS